MVYSLFCSIPEVGIGKLPCVVRIMSLTYIAGRFAHINRQGNQNCSFKFGKGNHGSKSFRSSFAKLTCLNEDGSMCVSVVVHLVRVGWTMKHGSAVHASWCMQCCLGLWCSPQVERVGLDILHLLRKWRDRVLTKASAVVRWFSIFLRSFQWSCLWSCNISGRIRMPKSKPVQVNCGFLGQLGRQSRHLPIDCCRDDLAASARHYSSCNSHLCLHGSIE